MSCRPRGLVTHKTKGGLVYAIQLPYLVVRLALILIRNLCANLSAPGLSAEAIANDTGGNPDAVLVARDGANSPLQG